MASVTFDHITKSWGDVVVVNDNSFEIHDGEFMVLVGPSGCGKSTSLRMIAGLEDVTKGTIKIGDRVVNDVASKDRDIAMVFQSYALYPHMSVYDNLAFGLKLRKMPKEEIDRRVQEAAKTIQLTDLLQRKPKELSGGQRQRVALGRAIVREPQVFLMDEPLSNLDAKLRVQTRAEILRIHKRLKTTIVYVTHDQVEAMTMGDRIAVMYQGYIQQVGPPVELYDYPVNRFVAGFIGSPSMNFVDVTANGSTLEAPGMSIPITGRLQAAIGSAAGRKVVAGFRPEHTEVGDGATSSATIQAKVDVVEFLGNDELLHLSAGGSELVVFVPSAQGVKVDQNVTLHIPVEKVHLFDPDSGLTLTAHGDRPLVGAAPPSALDEPAFTA